MIVSHSGGVTLIGGGEVTKSDLDLALSHAPYLVAADGGGDSARNFGLLPDVAIGDLDSLTRAGAEAIGPASVHRIADQESTDFEKCLANVEADFLIGVGFLGGRMDHAMAALNALVRNEEPFCVLIGTYDVVFALPKGHTRLSLWPGARVSLMPMTLVRGRSTGLEWPIDGIDFAPDGRIGTSNRSTQAEIDIYMEDRGMLVLLERRALMAVLKACALVC